MTEDELKVDIVEKMARKKVTGGHNKQVDTIKNWFASDDQGEVGDLIEELARDPNAPVQGYGGSRGAVRLTSIQDAKDWLDAHGRDLWWL
ncbi:hypothetical protein DMJ13_22875 [halophilic archaeon]|nr:hypothetical protein DMJ13_22875 [halophilic archaeon]